MNRSFIKYFAGTSLQFEEIDVLFGSSRYEDSLREETPTAPSEPESPPPSLPPPPPTPTEYPKVFRSNLMPTYEWNTEKDKTLTLDVFVSLDATYLKYYFANQPDNNSQGFVKVIASNGRAVIQLQNPGNIGTFQLGLVAGNTTVGDGLLESVPVRVSTNKYYGQPDITSIAYNKVITEADLKPLDFNFEFILQTVNSEQVEVFLGTELTTPIKDLRVENNSVKLVFAAKELYNTYRNRFGETPTTYNLVFSFRPYFNSIAGKETGKLETAQVTVNRMKFSLTEENTVEKISSAFGKLLNEKYQSQITFEDEKHLYYRIKYQDTTFNSFVIANIAADDITYSKESDSIVKTEFRVDEETGDTVRVQTDVYSSLVLKLLEPLPATIEKNTQVWIAKQILPTVIEDIILTGEDTDSCVTLLPNFNADVLEEMGYEYFGSIVGSGSVSSTQLVNKYLSQSMFSLEELNILYTSGSNTTDENFIQFQNFINFSSAKTRLENYQFKLESIQFWNNKAVSLSSSTASISLATSKSYSDRASEIINGFDGFENELYTQHSITGSNSTFFIAQSDVAERYDKENKNYLIRHLPRFVVEGGEQNRSPEFVLFMQMVGQHFDILWSYITGIRRVRDIRNINTEGVSDKLIHALLDNLGWEKENPFSSQQLWLDTFGLNEDGSQPINTNILGDTIIPIYTPEESKKQVWRRIINNLPYLLKHKGTRRSVHALLACYGIPSSLLSIMEFGGPAKESGTLVKYTYEDRTAALNLSETESITVPWKDGASSVQVRFRTIKKATQQLLRVIGDNGYDWRVELIPSYTGSFGTVKLEIEGEYKYCPYPGVLNTVSNSRQLEISGSVLFDGYYKNITIQREKIVSGSYPFYDRYTLYVQEGLDDRIIMSQVGSIDLQTLIGAPVTNNYYWMRNGWDSTGSVFIGSDTVGRVGISGSIDDFRIWNTALSASVIEAHTLNSDVIYGNNIYSNTEDLQLRLDFEYAKNRQSGSGDPYIRNVAPGVQFTDTLDSNGKQTISSGYTGWATASISTSASQYPYQYDVYERVVSALAPTFGFVPTDKVRLEDIELVSELSYRQRATVKSLDRAPIDSNRLGLFFSPVKDLNLDILKSLGAINVGNYIGDWEEEYNVDRYKQLDDLRHYYFKRIHININEYINLVKSIDKSLYDMIEQLIPARASLVSGLLIEPSLLERNKVRIQKPIAENNVYTSSVVTPKTVVDMGYIVYDTTIDQNDETELLATFEGKSGEIDTEKIIIPLAEISSLSATISSGDEGILDAGYEYKEVGIDCEIWKPIVLGEYDLETGYESAGNDAESPFSKGFGVVGKRGAVDRTYLRSDGTLVLTERVNAYILKIKYMRRVPDTDIDGNRVYEEVAKYVQRLVFVSQTDANAAGAYRTPLQHSFYTEIVANLGTFPYDKGVVVSIEPFDGYTSGHHRYTGDASRGMKASFFEGSKQTQATTTDSAPAWEVFATNPNVLKVNNTLRGSGEPILETN